MLKDPDITVLKEQLQKVQNLIALAIDNGQTHIGLLQRQKQAIRSNLLACGVTDFSFLIY